MNRIASLYIVWALGLTAIAVAEEVTPFEVSGVFYHDGAFFLVDDELNDVVYRYVHEGDLTPPAIVPLVNIEAEAIELNGDANDLESVAVLADGRLVALSENNHALVSAEEIVVQFSAYFREVANMGLEGLDVREGPDGASEIAAVFEGGYFRRADAGDVPEADVPRWPTVIHYMLPKGETGQPFVPGDHRIIRLEVPLPDDVPPPDGLRYRVPDIVWNLPGAEGAFIALLSSANSPKAARTTFGPKMLQRFDFAGAPVGDGIELSKLGIEPSYNWEGLCWVEPGKTLALVAEGSSRNPPLLAVVDISGS